MRIIKMLFILLQTALVSGCFHLHEDRTPSYLKPATTENRPDYHNEALNRLQIIVTFDGLHYSHSALRLIYDKKVLFWDPAGNYGSIFQRPEYMEGITLPADYQRKNDLIHQGAPDLDTYWRYSLNTGDSGMEIFEWLLNEDTAKKYFTILMAGAFDKNNPYQFETSPRMLLCSSSLTRFLMKHTPETIRLKRAYFWPDKLAHALYEQHPDRLLLFMYNRPTRYYVRDGESSRQASQSPTPAQGPASLRH
jgi:hypothetical protein